MRICLDFDGVLHDHAHRAPGKKMGPPIDGAHDAVWRLVRQGHEVTVHTSRVKMIAAREHVERWLAYFDFPPLAVHVFKPDADVYVDDRGLRHEGDWDVTMVKLRMLGATGGR